MLHIKDEVKKMVSGIDRYFCEKGGGGDQVWFLQCLLSLVLVFNVMCVCVCVCVRARALAMLA